MTRLALASAVLFGLGVVAGSTVFVVREVRAHVAEAPTVGPAVDHHD